MIGALKRLVVAAALLAPAVASAQPKPQEVVASGYEFAEKLLSSQRKFADEIVKTTAQLLPGDSK